MALSKEVISQFAKLATPEKKDEGAQVRGTYKEIDGVKYVQLDGSDILTPVEMTVSAETGEKVNVLIKNHEATVVENITSPGASSKMVDDLADIVDDQGNTIQRIDTTVVQQQASIIQMNTNINQHDVTLNQHETRINQQGDTITSLNNTVVAQGNQISSMNNTIIQQGDNINSMNNTIIQQGNNINSMNNTIQQHGNRITQNENTISQHGNTIIQQGNEINQQNNRIDQQDVTIQQMDDTLLSHGNLLILYGNEISMLNSDIDISESAIRILNSGFTIENGVLTGLSQIVIDDLETNTLNADYAQIDFANINIESVKKLFADSGIIKNLDVEEGHITGELVGVTIKGDLIEGNTIVADKLVVKGSDGLYYKLNTTGETLESEQTDENSLNGSVITAKSITATKISVNDLVAFGATIGGFEITDDSIHTHLKSSPTSPDNGLYLGSDGQIGFGNSRNHINYYKDDNDEYVLDVRLNKLYLGTSEQTADQQFQGMVELSADNLTATFKSTGGSNLIQNSVGYSDTDFWLVDGVVETRQDDTMSVSGSEFILTGPSSISQVYNTQPTIGYSVSFKYKHITSGTANKVSVKLEGNGVTRTVLETIEAHETWTNVYLDAEEYKATTYTPKIIITCEGDDTFEITDLIVSQGTNDVWSPYINEVYGKRNRFDEQGIRLYSEQSDDSSLMTSTNVQLKDGDSVVSELSRSRVYSQTGEFSKGTTIGRLKTTVIDSDNIIEYITDEEVV